MLLSVVPARQGLVWVREGLRLMKQQPIVLVGAQFLYLFVLLLISLIPALGPLLASLLVPALNAGYMETARLVSLGQPAFPHTVLQPLRASSDIRLKLLLSGLAYVVAILLILALAATLDEGVLLKGMLGLGDSADKTAVMEPNNKALMLFALCSAPLSLLFSVAPALVLWQGQSVGKSLFVSLVTMARNWRALAVFSLAWIVLMGGFMVLISSVVAAFTKNLYSGLLFIVPIAYVLMAAMFACFYVIYRDCLAAKHTDSSGK